MKKSAWLMMMALLPVIAWALPPTQSEADWIKLNTLTSGDTLDEPIDHLKSHGLAEDVARQLIDLVDEGNASPRSRLLAHRTLSIGSRCERIGS